MKDMILQSRRLTLTPLDPDTLALYIKDRRAALTALGIMPAGQRYEPAVQTEFDEALRLWHSSMQADPVNYLWHTNWMIILTSQNVEIGSFCFKGPPDMQGHVEIGYAILPEYRNRGFALETIELMTQWALEDVRVTAVIAEVPLDNIFSRRALEKAGFTAYLTSTESVFYKRPRPVPPSNAC